MRDRIPMISGFDFGKFPDCHVSCS